MTDDELQQAIAWFENRLSAAVMPGARKMFGIALSALREKQARENPKPLTLDELNARIGPVWAPLDNHSDEGYWCLCYKGEITPPSCMTFMAKDRPNWTFLAHKPKEAQEAEKGEVE